MMLQALALLCLAAVLAAPALTVNGARLAVSQALFLLDCQAAWGRTFPGWYMNNADCATVSFTTCDSSGMLLTISMPSQGLSGSIPTSIRNLISLTHMDLRGNSLWGNIPAEISVLSKLATLDLSNQQLTGSIPCGIGSLQSLRFLYVNSNKLMGSIPVGVSLLANLKELDVSRNQLSGTITADLRAFTQVTRLALAYNMFSGPFPPSVTKLTALVDLYCSNCQFSGPIPENIGALDKLTYFGLSHNQLTGSVPSSVTKLTTLMKFHLNRNMLTGTIPQNIGAIKRALMFDLADNLLTGSVPDSVGAFNQVYYMDLRSNMLSGSLPNSMSYLTALTYLDLSRNQYTGPIPYGMTSCTRLSYLDMSYNHLSGPIPSGIGSLRVLSTMYLQGNELTGNIPDSVSALSSLRLMRLGHNKLTGFIPTTIGSLARLLTLSLGFNLLYGNIPATINQLKQLYYSDLSHNYLTGPIVKPGSGSVDLSSNYLSGALPAPECKPYVYNGNCFILPDDCSYVLQRQESACKAFCGLSTLPPSNGVSAAAATTCGAQGLCYPYGTSFVPTCMCSPGFIKFGGIGCISQGNWVAYSMGNTESHDSGVTEGSTCTDGQYRSYFTERVLLPPATQLTSGVQQGAEAVFNRDPVTLFVYLGGKDETGCGVELAFNVNFTFALSPQSGTAGNNGFAFVVSASKVSGDSSGVGYGGGMEQRSVAVEFDTAQNEEYGDMRNQHVGLNIQGNEQSVVAVKSPYVLNNNKPYTAWVDYILGDPGTIQVFLSDSTVKPKDPVLESRLALCDLLQPGPEVAAGPEDIQEQQQQPAFFFGFVASTTAKPFQKNVILNSALRAGPSPPRNVTNINPAYNLTLSLDMYTPAGVSPFARYVSADYRLATNKQDSWVLRDFHTWDSVPFLGWPVKDQMNCKACWAYAVVTSVEAAYGIATNDVAPRLSVDSLFNAMGITSEKDKCSTGSSPTKAFEKLLTLNGSGLMTDSKPAQEYPIQGFERSWFKGYMGLILSVQRQPVVVHIEASTPTFVQYDGTYKYQDPGCYTGNLNHVVLVIGYFIFRDDGSQNRIAPPFWIIRNSWGVEWGDRGHMRMDIQGGDGVCGINVLPGIYPIVKVPSDPCGLQSFRGDGDLQPSMNPCGRFKCTPVTANNSNICDCRLPGVVKQPFVQVSNGNGFKTCAYVDVCGSYFKNPCYVGTCINDDKGSYSCVCPPNYIESRTIDNLPVCDPADKLITTLTVSGVNWWCSDVYPLMGISYSQFIKQNALVNCKQSLPKETVLSIAGSPTNPCTGFFYAVKGDQCSKLASAVGLTVSDLVALNPGLDCSMPIKAGRSVCVERNATFAFTVPECIQYAMLTVQDSCKRLLQGAASSSGEVAAYRWAELYRINPGLVCSSAIPDSVASAGSKVGVQVCLQAESMPFTAGICKKGRKLTVSRTLKCNKAYDNYDHGESEFRTYNGRLCANEVGKSFLCVPCKANDKGCGS